MLQYKGKSKDTSSDTSNIDILLKCDTYTR